MQVTSELQGIIDQELKRYNETANSNSNRRIISASSLLSIGVNFDEIFESIRPVSSEGFREQPNQNEINGWKNGITLVELKEDKDQYTVEAYIFATATKGNADDTESKEWMTIRSIGVGHEKRKKKLGSLMLDIITKYAKKKNFLYICANAPRLYQQEFFRKKGFRTAPTEKGNPFYLLNAFDSMQTYGFALNKNGLLYLSLANVHQEKDIVQETVQAVIDLNNLSLSIPSEISRYQKTRFTISQLEENLKKEQELTQKLEKILEEEKRKLSSAIDEEVAAEEVEESKKRKRDEDEEQELVRKKKTQVEQEPSPMVIESTVYVFAPTPEQEKSLHDIRTRKITGSNGFEQSWNDFECELCGHTIKTKFALAVKMGKNPIDDVKSLFSTIEFINGPDEFIVKSNEAPWGILQSKMSVCNLCHAEIMVANYKLKTSFVKSTSSIEEQAIILAKTPEYINGVGAKVKASQKKGLFMIHMDLQNGPRYYEKEDLYFNKFDERMTPTNLQTRKQLVENIKKDLLK